MDAAELVAAFEAQLASARGDRKLAIARLLAAGPGWREARDVLGGAFAEGPAEQRSDGRKVSCEGEINQRVSECLQRTRLKTNAIGND